MKMLEFTTTNGEPLYVVPDKITSVYPASRFAGVHFNYVGGSAQVLGKIKDIVAKINKALEESE